MMHHALSAHVLTMRSALQWIQVLTIMTSDSCTPDQCGALNRTALPQRLHPAHSRRLSQVLRDRLHAGCHLVHKGEEALFAAGAGKVLLGDCDEAQWG